MGKGGIINRIDSPFFPLLFFHAIFICNGETAYNFHPLFYSWSFILLTFSLSFDFSYLSVFFWPSYLVMHLFFFCFSLCVGLYGYLFVTFFPLPMCVYVCVYEYISMYAYMTCCIDEMLDIHLGAK